jgi:uncharacterized alpha-E superfamily protein
MLSRVASLIYWMSRYLERADNVARFIDVNARLILDMGSENSQWEPLVWASSDEAAFEKIYGKAYNEENVEHFLAFDRDNPNSILSCIEKTRENARTVREVITTEMWETINSLYHLVREAAGQENLDFQMFCQQVHQLNHTFVGLMDNTMSHTEAWHFAYLGRILERADKTSRILDVKYFLLLPGARIDSPHDALQWGAVLRSVSGFEMYRKIYHRAQYRNVTRFMVLDEHFPRSIRFCISAANESLLTILAIHGFKADIGQLQQLSERLANSSVDDILNRGLHEFINDTQILLNQIDNDIYKTFFERKNAV